MRTTLNLDDELVRQALKETGVKTKTAVLELGLRALLEKQARVRLRAMQGRLPNLKKARRRRP
jgi:Arc/MetJ family transcription regulator